MSTYQRTPGLETTTLVDMLRWRAEHQSHREAFHFARPGNDGTIHMSHAEMDHKARAIAALLQDQRSAGKPVLILLQPGLEYITAFFGCLYAGAIAIPGYPPHSARSVPRIQAIVEDSQAEVVLTSAKILADLRRYFSLVPHLKNLHWIATDILEDDDADRWHESKTDPAALAFLQYTSGSTGAPRGVMVTHSNLMYNLVELGRLSQQTPDSHIVTWVPPFHDLGLICGVLLPFYVGCPTTLISPMTFLQRPFFWLETISSVHGTMSQSPNFGYELCCNKVTPEQIATLDLSHWESVVCGGEPVRKETMDRFTRTFGPAGFRYNAFLPGYGMAETTLVLASNTTSAPAVTRTFHQEHLKRGHAIEVSSSDPAAKYIIGYEEVAPGQKVIVVDLQTQTPCPPGLVGEIWTRGPSVTQGYWQKPIETAQVFNAYLSDTQEGPFLRTGDLGFILDDLLFVTGRHKDVIIIHGNNYYPQDIEAIVDHCHPAIRPTCAVACSVEENGTEQLVVMVEIEARYLPRDPSNMQETSISRKPLDPQEVIRAIRSAVSEEYDLHITHVVLLKAGGILKTSSGKVQRRACRAEFIAGRLELWYAQNQ
jgi:acyl-CoA synthetase (AMP-forming)/AMP-acid ligase II